MPTTQTTSNAKNGTGTTITWETGFLAEVIDLTPPGATREMIKTSHMETLRAHTYIVGQLIDWGEMVVEVAFDPGLTPPIESVFSTAIVNFPDGEIWTMCAAMSGYTPRAPMEERMTATCTLKISGWVTQNEDSSGA